MLSLFLFIFVLILGAQANPLILDTRDTVSDPQTASGHSIGKRGLPYHNPPDYIQNFNSKNSQVSWAYDWASARDPSFPKYLEYVPLLWSAADSLTKDWFANVKNAMRHGTKSVLAFNEPDLCGKNGQACMTPQQAADAWMKWMQPLAGKVRLGGPACTEGYSGTAWLKQFLALCTKCTIDFIPVHMYSSVDNYGHFQRHVQDIRNVTGKPIWVTELHAAGNETAQISFLKEFMQWMDAQDYVERYAWYLASPKFTGGSLVGSDSKPTKLGMVYELSQPSALDG